MQGAARGGGRRTRPPVVRRPCSGTGMTQTASTRAGAPLAGSRRGRRVISRPVRAVQASAHSSSKHSHRRQVRGKAMLQELPFQAWHAKSGFSSKQINSSGLLYCQANPWPPIEEAAGALIAGAGEQGSHLDGLGGVEHRQADVCSRPVLRQLHARRRCLQHNQPQHGSACAREGAQHGCRGGRARQGDGRVHAAG